MGHDCGRKCTQHPILQLFVNSHQLPLERAHPHTQNFTISRLQSKSIKNCKWYKACNVNTRQRAVSFPRTFDIQFPSELSSSAVWNCPLCSHCLLKKELIGNFYIRCRAPQPATVSASDLMKNTKTVSTYCMPCTHNPGSTFLWDAAFFAEDNSLSHMFVLGITMHPDLTHAPVIWLNNSNYLEVSPSLLNQK